MYLYTIVRVRVRVRMRARERDREKESAEILHLSDAKGLGNDTHPLHRYSYTGRKCIPERITHSVIFYVYPRMGGCAVNVTGKRLGYQISKSLQIDCVHIRNSVLG